MIKVINKKDIFGLVKREIKSAKKEIVATMLLREERESPLPNSYHALLKKKLGAGVQIKRLGFGRKVDYTVIKQRLVMPSKNYQFRYTSLVLRYQRLLIIDRKMLFFGMDGVFFQSSHKPLVEVFFQYFTKAFDKGKI